MGLEQFFGVISAIDCTENMWLTGVVGLVVGALSGAIVMHLLQYWKD